MQREYRATACVYAPYSFQTRHTSHYCLPFLLPCTVWRTATISAPGGIAGAEVGSAAAVSFEAAGAAPVAWAP